MKITIALTVVLMTLSFTTFASAADANAPAHATASSISNAPHAAPATTAHAPHGHALRAHEPVLTPAQTRWTGAMLIIIAGMFLAAAMIGWMHDLHAPHDSEDAHGHAQDDAHSRGHGHGTDHGHSAHH